MKRILLVEDDQLLSKLYVDLMSKYYTVVHVSNGEHAFEKINEDGWDLILLDTLLPKMNALEVIKKIEKDQPEKLKQKIVIITNLEDNKVLTELKKYSAGILIKSHLNPKEFLEKIKEYAGS